MKVYLDLNIFDMIEKSEKPDRYPMSDFSNYQLLKQLINTNKIIVPYSNAHLNDLFRGYQKNPAYIDSHLSNIGKLTDNLCLCQYWNDSDVTWHRRSIDEFFNEKKEDRDFESDTFEDLLVSIGIPGAIHVFASMPLDSKWRLGYQDPVFGIMFPRSKNKSNVLSLLEDIHSFHARIKLDYSLYKQFKVQLIQSTNRLKNNPQAIKIVQQRVKDLPKHLDIFSLSELYEPKQNVLKNRAYSKVLDIFFKYDLKGYKTDGNFNNMFDDSLHTFYASHCDFFITNDDRCKYKAEKTYEKLKITTQVITIDELGILLSAVNDENP